MERLLSVLEGEVKHSVISIGRIVFFMLLRLGNGTCNVFEIKSVLDLPQISTHNRTGLWSFHQQPKSLIPWLKSMDDISFVDSIGNTSKAVIWLSKNQRSQFYKDLKEKTFRNYHLKLKDWRNGLEKNWQFLSPYNTNNRAPRKKILEYIKEVLRENKSVHSAFGTLGTSDS